jgi:hypothetical protein
MNDDLNARNAAETQSIAERHNALRELHARIARASNMAGAERAAALQAITPDAERWLAERPRSIAARARPLPDVGDAALAEQLARAEESLDLLAETLWFEYQFATGAKVREPGVGYADAAADVEAVGTFLRQSGVRV